MPTKLPNKTNVVDQQFVNVKGPDGLLSGFQYDIETCSFYAKESQIIIPPFHGQTHIAEDPIPGATINTPGLMSADDKAKLDTVTSTRIGVLGFQGAGFPDDGGWLQGDIILQAGTEFISLERIGNIVRFTVDSPIPLNCGIEECAQIFWIQDETDIAAIRPPSCAGKLPGANLYGEVKVFLMPESTILNTSNPATTLNTKLNYPAFVFKRYDDAITPGLGEIEAVLERNSNGTTKTGWAMTPGPSGVPECVWFMGKDDDGGQVRFDLGPNSEPGLLGSLLYKGHTITRQMAVVTSWTSSILTTNQYNCRFWSVNKEEPIGDVFVATNVWGYENPENEITDVTNPRRLMKDATEDLIPVGSLTQIWEFEIGEVNGERLVRRYFSKEPKTNEQNLWAIGGIARFGDVLTARWETTPGGDTELTGSEDDISDIRTFDHNSWGITGFEDPLLLDDDNQSTGTVSFSGSILSVTGENNLLPLPNVEFETDGAFIVNEFVNELTPSFVNFPGLTGIATENYSVVGNTTSAITIIGLGPLELENEFTLAGGSPQDCSVYTPDSSGASGIPINNRFVANVDFSIPGLIIEQLHPDEDRERPVFLWNRTNYKNVYIKAMVGMPQESKFPPLDVLMRAPADSHEDINVQVSSRGTQTDGAFAGAPFITIVGVGWNDIPKEGTLRILTGIYRDTQWKYRYKLWTDGITQTLIGETNFPFDGDFLPGVPGGDDPTTIELPGSSSPTNTTMCEIMHEDYTAPCVRFEFSVNTNTDAEAVQLQVKGGILDMGEAYELDLDLPEDNYVRGMRPGYAISKTYTQDGFITTGIETPESDPSGFVVYEGGELPSEINGEPELWNKLELLLKGDQMWVWWNDLLIPPDALASADLPTPVAVNTPYFPLEDWEIDTGKVVFRMWPGTILREVEVRGQLTKYSEYTHGQLEVSSTGT